MIFHCIKKNLKEKNKLHAKYKLYANKADSIAFGVLRLRAKRVELECYNNYIYKTENSIKKNPKAFWSYVQANKQHNSYPSSMTYNDRGLSSGEDICNAFAEYFNSVYLPVTSPSNSPATDSFISNSIVPSPIADISSIEIVEAEVLKILKSLDGRKSAGPDGLHPVLISNCTSSLTFPVCVIFKRSINEGFMPKVWKEATVTPIHKKGSKREITNYRPISKLCVFAKVIERVIHNQMYVALKHTFLPQQHGFLGGRSTVSNLIAFTDDLSKGMESGGQVDAVYTDYAKAFDRIDHVILLEKLQAAGIHGDLLRWFCSYVQGRCQTVVLNGYSSNSPLPSTIPSGVPQGSILGPLLFVLFINDINECFVNSAFLLFADDMKVYKKVNSMLDCLLLQQDLDRLQGYCHKNKLDLNVSKCNCISFTRSHNAIHFDYSLNQQSLQRTDYIRDLGVILDSKLILDRHVETITSKAMRTLGFIFRITKNFKTVKSLKILYCSLVRSQLEYASQVWNPRYDRYSDKIEKIQRKFLRFVNYRYRLQFSDHDTSCKHHHLLPLSLRREVADLSFLHNLVRNKVDCSNLLSKIKLQLPTRTVTRRNYLKLHVDSCVTNYRLNSFFNRVCSNFNSNYSENVDLFIARQNFFVNYACLNYFRE